MNTYFDLTVIGGGLAGSEATLQAASRGLNVHLFEMRPKVQTGVHNTAYFSELVCSNSFGSMLPNRASGLLKKELELLGSFLLDIAYQTSLPAGRALAVDRNLFSRMVTEKILSFPNIHVTYAEAQTIPEGPTIIATGPLTSPNFSKAISELTGEDSLYFYDAVAPIINFDSIDFNIAFHASRYQQDQPETKDYINLPFTKDQYYSFVEELVNAERNPLKSFEVEIKNGVKAGSHEFFEGCLPIEILAQRGPDSLAFGPMRPVGLIDTHTNFRPFAVIQLRQDNLAGDLYNMVGFQTNLKVHEQIRIFRTIPGLENAQFERFGQMHRNTFIASPKVLHPSLQFRGRSDIFFAGQITGVEGYAGNIATGLLAGWNAFRLISHNSSLEFPETTMLGALCHYITHADISNFQPMKANFGILPAIISGDKLRKQDRFQEYSNRSMNDMETYLKLL
jgi:methylenetetrahydrofolate--tRNA-(uracil-5-)-methyltransferase